MIKHLSNPRAKVIGNIISCEPLGCLGRGFSDTSNEDSDEL
jgi:hypothetical protein